MTKKQYKRYIVALYGRAPDRWKFIFAESYWLSDIRLPLWFWEI